MSASSTSPSPPEKDVRGFGREPSCHPSSEASPPPLVGNDSLSR
ncbi:hypothetical protein STIAU_4970, partial [Stigmatella aurantiaca DW4/3-1]